MRDSNSPALLFRTIRKLRRLFKRLVLTVRRTFVRSVYQLPLMNRNDPRRKIVTFRDYCPVITNIPPVSSNVGDWIFTIRRGETIHRQDPISLNDVQAKLFQEGSRKHQSGNCDHLPDVFVACVENARLYSSDFLVLSPKNQIFLESALSRIEYLEANGILDTLIKPKLKYLPGSFVLLANRSVKAYYHWLIDVLPRLASVEQCSALADVPLVLPSKLQPFNRDSLKMVGIDGARITPIDPSFYQVDRLYYPEIQGPTGHPSPHAIRWLREKLAQHSPTSSRCAKRRIYLTRRDAHQRRVLNEPELTLYLQGLGFEVICPGDHTFAEQIALFRDVEVVIAPHGAGLTNIAFSPVGATVIEFFGDNYINGCFWAIANICRHRHAFLVGPSSWLDYSIPLSDLKEMLRKLGLVSG